MKPSVPVPYASPAAGVTPLGVHRSSIASTRRERLLPRDATMDSIGLRKGNDTPAGAQTVRRGGVGPAGAPGVSAAPVVRRSSRSGSGADPVTGCHSV